MSYSATIYNIMISAPSDTIEECRVAYEVIHAWNAAHAEHENIVLVPLDWKKNTHPEAGTPAQKSINRQITTKVDLLIAIFKHRLGTSTEKAISGTVEEIQEVVNAGKPTLLYFSDEAVSQAASMGEQWQKLAKFRQECSSKDYYHSFSCLQSFKESLTQHLAKLAHSFSKTEKHEPPTAPTIINITEESVGNSGTSLSSASLRVEEDCMAAKVINAEHLFRPTAQESASPVVPQKQKTKAKSAISQMAKGEHIVQTAGNINGDINMNINATSKKVNVSIQPPAGSIGANSFLIERISSLFNELGNRRKERVGESAFPVMYKEFKKAFDLSKNQKYTDYKLWPESRGEEIITYLEQKLSNTIKGRKQSAASRKGHSKPYLLGETGRLHKLLGWSDQEFRGHLHYLFGVTSRSGLSQSQLANYVAYLKDMIDKQS